MARKLEAKMRTFAPVIVRGEETQGVRFWGFGKTVYQELLSVIADPDYGDITDPVNGRDVSVEFITAEESGASFPKTSIRVKPNQTPIVSDKAQLENILENQCHNKSTKKKINKFDVLALWRGSQLCCALDR